MVARRIPGQLELALDDAAPSVTPTEALEPPVELLQPPMPSETPTVVLHGEALPPEPEQEIGRQEIQSSEAIAAARYAPFDGQRENAVLLHRMGKFEDRANAAMYMSLGVAVLALFAKAGIPLSSALLERAGLPGIGDGRMLAGMLAIVTAIVSGAAVCFVLMVRHYTEQFQLPVMRRTMAGDIAQAVFRVAAVAYIVVIVGVVGMCLGDMLYAVTYLRDHLMYTMTGWEPIAP